MIAKYLEEVCRSLDISDGSGNLEARACCADELCVVLLILGILRNRNYGEARVFICYTACYRENLGNKERLTVCKRTLRV